MRRVVLAAIVLLVTPLALRAQETRLVATLTSDHLANGIVAELAWDGGTLIVQAVTMSADGRMDARYFAVAAEGMQVQRLPVVPNAAVEYWRRKANRVSPTGFGRIADASDAKLPMVGVGTLDRRLRDSADMGGVQTRQTLRVGGTIIHERTNAEAPYDGEVWSWSPAELNRIAYVDAKGDLWVARADGAAAQRLVKGDFTLPAWSEDGRVVAIAQRKAAGHQWDISVVYLPESLRTPPGVR